MLTQIRLVVTYILNLEIWIITMAVGLSFVSSRLLPLAPLVAFAFCILRWILTNRPVTRTPADLAILGLLVMAPVTVWVTVLPNITIPQVYRLLNGIALYYAIANWAVTKFRLRWLVWGSSAVGVLLALFALVSVEWPTSKWVSIPVAIFSRFKILVADAVHPNVMAGSLVIILPVALAVLLFGWKQLNQKERPLVIAAVIGMVGVLGLTLSRGAWVAFASVLIVLVCLRWRFGWLSLTAVGVGATAFCLDGGLTVQSKLFDFVLRDANARLEYWSRAIMMIQDFSITGIGMGSFGSLADAMYPFSLSASGSVPHSHNLILQVAVDLGIPGLISWLAILVLMILSAWRVYRVGRAQQNYWLAGLGAGLLASQVALVVHGIFDAVTWGMVRPAPLVWVIWGLCVAALHLVEQGDRSSEKLVEPVPS